MAAPRRRLKNLELSHLLLEGFWLESISLTEKTSTRSKPGHQPTVSHDVLFYNADDDPGPGTEHLVRLRIKATQPAEDGSYTEIDATLLGRFSISEEVEDSDTAQWLIQFNAPAILYGVLRGIVAPITAIGMRGRIDLPSVNLLPAR